MYCEQRSQYIRFNSKKNSFRGNYWRKYGTSNIFLKNHVLTEVFVSIVHRVFLKYLNGRLFTFDVEIVIPTWDGIYHTYISQLGFIYCTLVYKTKIQALFSVSIECKFLAYFAYKSGHSSSVFHQLILKARQIDLKVGWDIPI